MSPADATQQQPEYAIVTDSSDGNSTLQVFTITFAILGGLSVVFLFFLFRQIAVIRKRLSRTAQAVEEGIATTPPEPIAR
eukprot:4076444-Pleurochrysis_carterae.AAC.1